MNTPSTTRQMASTASSSGRNAVAKACREAVESLGGDIGLLLAFASGDLDQDRAARALADAAPSSPVAGLTGNGLLTREGQLQEGCVAMAFGSQLKAAVGVAREASRDLREAGHTATSEALHGLGVEADIVLMFIDSTHGDIADTVAGAYAAAGPKIPLAGGAAGGAEKWHFHGGEATTDSVVAVAIQAEGPVAIAETQTSSIRGAPAIVTRSEGQLISEIDGRAAQDVYLEQIGFAGMPLDDEEFEAISIIHPIAQPELHGERRLRHVLGRDESGALIVGTHIPQGAVVEFTELELVELLNSGAGSVEKAAQALGATPQAALVFDCAGRRRALGNELNREVEAVAAALGAGPAALAGLYTNGEVARLKGAKGDRNHAVVTVAFG
jgi:hypothetical protein